MILVAQRTEPGPAWYLVPEYQDGVTILPSCRNCDGEPPTHSRPRSMRVLLLLGRTGLRSPRLLGSTPRALPSILAVRQHLLSAHKALPPALAVPTVKHEQTNLRVLQLIAAGSVLGVLAQSYEPASCGKRKKKDTNQDDDMYELDHIKARMYMASSSSAKRERVCRPWRNLPLSQAVCGAV